MSLNQMAGLLEKNIEEDGYILTLKMYPTFSHINFMTKF